MSFDDYVHHISQKYRLAVAISVIKTKPENVSVEEFLMHLQNKIRNEETDLNETVCSDDFNFDDDDTQCNTTIDCPKNNMFSESQLVCPLNEISQGSQTILKDFVFDEGCSQHKESSLGDTIRLLKEVANVEEQPYRDQNYSQMTFCESQEDDKNCYDIPNVITDSNYKQDSNVKNNNMDSQETQLYTLHGFTQDYSHVSQTQNEYFIISDKYLRNHITIEHKDANKENGDILKYNDSQKVFNKDKENVEKKNDKAERVKESNNFANIQTEMIHKSDKASKTIISNVAKNIGKETDSENNQKTMFQVNNQNNIPDYNNEDYISKENNIKETYTTRTIANDTNVNNTKLSTSQITDNLNFEKNTQCATQKDATQTDNIDNAERDNDTNFELEMDVETEDEILEERIPFKVIEELNRVKTFLNRRDKKSDEYSTDSGYRSDSQLRGSLRSCSQPSSENWLNQSAYCLFNHIMQSLPTDDIVKEIAQVLSKLIDNLHENENYPPFLEQLLETIDGMIHDIHTGDGWADNLILTKEENIQRVFLLNKSKHILMYSIDKITGILQNVHTHLIQEDLYECTNIVDLENLCYIFNILETLIKRYKKVKNVSQNHSSQEILPKRSSLTELWRKKWNPNCKEIVKNDNKICVLKKCSEILNKMIVGCMSGYSLVAYSALQCFNLIQD